MRLSLHRSLALPRVRPAWLVWEAYQKFLRDDALPMAGAIAYSALFSVFPLLLGVIAVVSLFVDRGQVRQALMATLVDYLPPETAAFVDRNVAEVLRARGTFGVVAILGLFWSATSVAAMVRHTLNRIWGVQQPRPFLFRKLVELALVAAGGLFLMTSLISSAALRVLSAYPGLAPAVSRFHQWGGSALLGLAAPVLLSALALLVIYRYLPNVLIPWRNAVAGAVVGGILFEVTKRAFFWYLESFARYEVVYGSLTGIIVFLVWLYVSAVILLFGAELAYQVGRPMPQEGPGD